MHRPSNHDSSSHPLLGMTFCCTSVSVELRNNISSKCKAMGGVCYEDLKNDVNYLIVGERHTPKYEFATQHRFGMVFLLPEFTIEVHKLWISGQKFDIGQEIEKYKLPVFAGMTISCTRISEGRQELINQLTKNGGKYSPELTKNIAVLISPFKQGRKYDYAKLWGIPIVHPNWIQRSIEIGAALDEKLFDLNIDPENMMKGPQQLSPKSTRKKYADSNDTFLPLGDNYAPKNDLKSVLGGFPTVCEDRLDNESSKDFTRRVLKKPVSIGPFDIDEDQDIDFEKNSVSSKHKVLKRPIIFDNRINHQFMPKPKDVSSKQHGVFSGLNFEFHGFDTKQIQILVNIVLCNGGTVSEFSPRIVEAISYVPNSNITSHYIINSKSPPHLFEKLSLKLCNNSVIKTEWFIERSISQGAYQLYRGIWGDYVMFRNLPTFKNLRISISGYEDIELLQAERLIHMLGATYSPVFKPTVDILICKTNKCKKFQFAKLWKVPIVKDSWLWCCAKMGLFVDLADWLLKGQNMDNLNPPSNQNGELGHKNVIPMIPNRIVTANIKKKSKTDHKGDGEGDYLAALDNCENKNEAEEIISYKGKMIHDLPNAVADSDRPGNILTPIQGTATFQNKKSFESLQNYENECGNEHCLVETEIGAADDTSEASLTPKIVTNQIRTLNDFVRVKEISKFSELLKRSKSYSGSIVKDPTIGRENSSEIGPQVSAGRTESEGLCYTTDSMAFVGGRLRGRATRSNFSINSRNTDLDVSSSNVTLGPDGSLGSKSVIRVRSLTSIEDIPVVPTAEVGYTRRDLDSSHSREDYEVMNKVNQPTKPSLSILSQSELSQSQTLFVGYSNINEKEEKRKLLQAFGQLDCSQLDNQDIGESHIISGVSGGHKCSKTTNNSTHELEGPRLFQVNATKNHTVDIIGKRKSGRRLRIRAGDNPDE